MYKILNLYNLYEFKIQFIRKFNENINIEFHKFKIYFQVIDDMDLLDRVKFIKDNFRNNDNEYNKSILET